MSMKLDPAAAKILAARQGVGLSDQAAQDAAQSMAGLLDMADAHMRGLAFEAEPGTYVAAQRRSRR